MIYWVDGLHSLIEIGLTDQSGLRNLVSTRDTNESSSQVPRQFNSNMGFITGLESWCDLYNNLHEFCCKWRKLSAKYKSKFNQTAHNKEDIFERLVGLYD